MPFQMIFGDDEHTAADGPYSRLMKTRKWVYLSSVAAIVLDLRLYDPIAAKKLFTFIALPPSVIGATVFLGLLYLIAQYTLLLGQLWVSYDLVLEERLSFRRAEEIAAAKQRLDIARADFSDREAQRLNDIEEELKKSRAAASVARADRDKFDSDSRTLVYNQGGRITPEYDAMQQRVEFLNSTIEGSDRRTADLISKMSAPSGDVDESPDVVEALKALNLLRAQNPADRRGYRIFEQAIDGLRLVPPLLFGSAATFKLGWFLVSQ